MSLNEIIIRNHKSQILNRIVAILPENAKMTQALFHKKPHKPFIFRFFFGHAPCETNERQTICQRPLQEGEIRRVGSNANRKVDARIVAATNRNLEEEVKNGNFREDLFYRLSVVTLQVPALRERATDISILVEKFLLKARKNTGKENLCFSEDALNTLQMYEWKGNVRELEAAIEYAALRARGNEILTEDLPVKLLSEEFKQHASRFHLSQLYGDLPKLDELEKRYLMHVLEKTAGNRTRTAEILGIDRRTLYRMAERFGINLD